MGHKQKVPSIDGTPRDGSQNGTTSAFAQLSFAEVLEDLSSRFIVNLPAEELASIERICFQVEQAHWFYEDFLRPLNPSLTSFSLRRFSSHLLHTSALTVPLIQRYISTSSSGKHNQQQDLEAAFDEFMKYKIRVPVCGIVMLNQTWDKCLLVKGWKSSAAWGFPKGKINQQESERDCAVREVLEETGYDCGHFLKPVSKDFMELTMREQKIRLYIVSGVDEGTHFETLTRKEISKIAWFKLSDLPTWKKNKAPPQGMGGKFYLISPFIGKLKQWIQENKPQKVVATTTGDNSKEPASIKILSNKEEEGDVRSDDLKALLGLGQSKPQGMGKGRQMIEEQGDARSRQLLDLLEGDSSTTLEDQRDPTDERESGTATLLAALNAGAGKANQLPLNTMKDSEMLLSMLKGAGSVSASANMLSFPTSSSSPLLAPQPQNTTQAQSLLSLISPGHNLAPMQSASTVVDREQERARQRDALLNGLLGPSSSFNNLSIQSDERRVDDFRFPQFADAPPSISLPPAPATTLQQNNLLSLLQPANAPNRDEQQPAPTPSPFSTFVQQATQASPPVRAQNQNPLLSLLNDNGSNIGGVQAATSPPPPLSHHSPYPPTHSPYPIHQLSQPPPFPHQFMAFPPPPPPFHSGYLAQAAPAPHNPYQSIPPPPVPQHFHHAPPSSHPASDVLARLLPS